MFLRFDNPADGGNYTLESGVWITPSVSGGGDVIAQVRHAGNTTVSISAAGLLVARGGRGDEYRFDSPLLNALYVYDTATATTTGGQTIVSGGGQVIANGTGGQVGQTATISGGGTVTTATAKNAVGEWFVEWWVHLVVATQKNAEAQPIVSGGGSVAALGNPGGVARVRGGGAVSVTPSMGAQDATSISAGGTLTASGFFQIEAGAGAATVSGGGAVTAAGTGGEARYKTVTLSGGGAVAISATKATTKQPAISGTGTIAASGGRNVLGSLSITAGLGLTVTGRGPGQVIREIELEGRVITAKLEGLIRV